MAAKLTFVERDWTKQPSTAVDGKPDVIGCCLPILSPYGYSPAKKTSLYNYFGTAGAFTLGETKDGWYFSQTHADRELSDYLAIQNGRISTTLVSDFTLFALPATTNIHVAALGTNSTSYVVAIQPDGSVKINGSSASYVLASAAGVVSPGHHVISVAMVSASGDQQTVTAYLDGVPIISGLVFWPPIAYRLAPRKYGSPIHDSSSLGVHMCAYLHGVGRAPTLHLNPWQIFEPEQIPLFYSAGGGGATNLSIFDALHSHAGDNLTFSLDTYLAAQDSTHAHSADNLTLDAITSISLVLSESLHGLSSDVIAFITGSYLQVADALHGHSADALTLATASFLAVADALHAHAADNLTLDTSNATPLTTQDSTHAHSADNNALTLDTWLAIVEAVHTHSADNVSISSEELLAIADALHSLASDALLLSIPSAPGTCPTAAEIAAAILAAAQITPIYSDIRKVNNLSVNGSGTDGDPWGPV